MEYLEWIIKIGGAITAVVLIAKAIATLVHLADDIKEIKKHIGENDRVSEDIKEIKEHTFENYLSCLRLTIMSRDMPLGERIIAGDKYIKSGGNGEVKKFVDEELHVNELKKD